MEVPKLMKSLRELKLVETPPEKESKKKVGEEAGRPGLQAKTASGSTSLIQMLHFVQGMI